MLKWLIYKILLRIGDVIMMAMFFATRVINGRNTFEQVPNSLKPQVYDILVENGVEHLANGWKPTEPTA